MPLRNTRYPVDRRQSCYLIEFGQRESPLGNGSVFRGQFVCFLCPVGLLKLHRLAQDLQFGIGDAVKPHPQLKKRHGQNLSRLRIRAFNERGTAFLELSDNGTQMRV